MKKWSFVFGLVLAACMLLPAFAADKIRVLVITGGHDFEKEQFFKLFRDNEGIAFKAVAHPNAHALLKTAASEYDVIVLYDMWQKISDEARADFLAYLKSGKGLVALHHCLASYQDWPEYARIIGGRYNLKPRKEDGREIPGSTYKHGVDFKVQIADPQHPVTRGLTDFNIHDETYGKLEVFSDVKPLLTTDEPTSTRTIGWTRQEGTARVVYIQLGHDHLAYENPAYVRLIAQAIQWAAKRD